MRSMYNTYVYCVSLVYSVYIYLVYSVYVSLVYSVYISLVYSVYIYLVYSVYPLCTVCIPCVQCVSLVYSVYASLVYSVYLLCTVCTYTLCTVCTYPLCIVCIPCVQCVRIPCVQRVSLVYSVYPLCTVCIPYVQCVYCIVIQLLWTKTSVVLNKSSFMYVCTYQRTYIEMKHLLTSDLLCSWRTRWSGWTPRSSRTVSSVTSRYSSECEFDFSDVTPVKCGLCPSLPKAASNDDNQECLWEHHWLLVRFTLELLLYFSSEVVVGEYLINTKWDNALCSVEGIFGCTYQGLVDVI